MMSLKQQMQSYGAYHKDPRNKLTHFVGVPLVTFSLFLALGWFRFVHPDILPITAATIFYVGVVIYYLRLDWSVALLQFPITLILLMVSDWVADLLRPVGIGIPGHLRAGLDHPAHRPCDRGPAAGAGRQYPPGLQRAPILDHRGAGEAETPQGPLRFRGFGLLA